MRTLAGTYRIGNLSLHDGRDNVWIGSKVGRWLVIGPHFKADRWRVVVECECGSVRAVQVSAMRHKTSLSCGCLARDVNTIHGGAFIIQDGIKKKDRLYKRWCDIKRRCHSPKSANYCRYGAVGITVCEEWRDDFLAFKAWALTHGFSSELTIDRVDPTKGYAPENCRWITLSENCSRVRHVKTGIGKRVGKRQLTVNGVTLSIREWSQRTGITLEAIKMRLRYGWHPDRIIQEPMKPNRRRKPVDAKVPVG